MFEVSGNYATAKVFAKTLEETAREQIELLCSQEFTKDAKIRIMPDVHAGKGCTIGFTADLGEMVIPNIVGVDIGCLDKDTEILTPNGWLKISKYSDEQILNYDYFNDTVYFDKPIKYIKEPCNEFYQFKNSKNLDQVVSAEHHMLVYRGYKNRGFTLNHYTAKELYDKITTLVKADNYSAKAAFESIESGLPLTDTQIRLLIAVSADGCIRKIKDSTARVEMHFKKPRKINRMRELLNNAKIPFKQYSAKDGSCYISFYSDIINTKDLTQFYRASKQQLMTVCDEALFWDGSIDRKRNHKVYYTVNKQNADVIQFAFSATGVRSTISELKSDNSSWSTYYSVIPTQNQYVGYKNDSVSAVKIECVDGFKYCFKTSTDAFVIRRNNKISVTGNCGMLCVKLGNNEIDFNKLDEIIRKNIPYGCEVHEGRIARFPKIQEMNCYRNIKDSKRVIRSLGSLGGGNHFIEIDKDDDGCIYLVIHTGSRNLGKQVAEHYQAMAYDIAKGADKLYEAQKKLIEDYKVQGRRTEIQGAIIQMKREFKYKESSIPKDLCYLTGEYRQMYLDDMAICQEFATLNRELIAELILSNYFDKSLSDYEHFETIHNYIDLKNNIVRKGAVSAQKSEKLLIPINMRDGSLICIGKGNEDWNCSAPHGAGRILSRSKALENLSMDEYRSEMSGIFTTCISESTLDESPMAYKDKSEIVECIEPTAEIINQIKPIYNFKAN